MGATVAEQSVLSETYLTRWVAPFLPLWMEYRYSPSREKLRVETDQKGEIRK